MQERKTVKHLSVTKIECAMKCPEQFRYRYEEKVPEPSIGILLAGRVVHGLIERALKQLALGRSLPSAKDMDDWFLPEWEAQAKEEEEKENFMGWEWDEDMPEARVKPAYRALVPFTRNEILPAIRPMVMNGVPLIEHETKIQFESEIGSFLVWGYLDVVEENKVLSDWKTTMNKPSANQKKMGMQFPGYSHEMIRLFGDEVTECRKIFLIAGAKPGIAIENYKVGPSHRSWFARAAAEVWKMAQSHAYVPNTGGWWCSADWCSFWDICQGEIRQGE